MWKHDFARDYWGLALEGAMNVREHMGQHCERCTRNHDPNPTGLGTYPAPRGPLLRLERCWQLPECQPKYNKNQYRNDVEPPTPPNNPCRRSPRQQARSEPQRLTASHRCESKTSRIVRNSRLDIIVSCRICPPGILEGPECCRRRGIGLLAA